MKPTSPTDGNVSGWTAAYQISPKIQHAIAAANAVQAARSRGTRRARELTMTQARIRSPL